MNVKHVQCSQKTRRSEPKQFVETMHKFKEREHIHPHKLFLLAHLDGVSAVSKNRLMVVQGRFEGGILSL